MFDTKEQSTLHSVLDAIQLPAFSIEVLSSNTFELSGINETHAAVSGMDCKAIIGARPADLLNAKDARAVAIKYNECAVTKKPLQYFEKLDMPHGEISWFTSLIPIMDRDENTVRLIGNAVGFKARDDAPLTGHVLNDLDYLSAESAIPIYKALELVRSRLDDTTTRPDDRRYFSAFRDLCQTALSGSNRLRSVFTYLRAENGKVPAFLKDSALSKAIQRIDPDWSSKNQ